ncbi:hypothetical protein TNCV_2296651 [Trichonephila clavipes]|nr:hypothetical protein TNCV_2296651 [Trichonephila clavipes]
MLENYEEVNVEDTAQTPKISHSEVLGNGLIVLRRLRAEAAKRRVQYRRQQDSRSDPNPTPTNFKRQFIPPSLRCRIILMDSGLAPDPRFQPKRKEKNSEIRFAKFDMLSAGERAEKNIYTQTILRHFGNMFGSSLNTESIISVLNIEKQDTFRGRTEPIRGELSSLKEDFAYIYYIARGILYQVKQLRQRPYHAENTGSRPDRGSSMVTMW